MTIRHLLSVSAAMASLLLFHPCRAAAEPSSTSATPVPTPTPAPTPALTAEVLAAAWPHTTEEIAQRGLVSTGDMSRLIRVMQKAERGEEITIAAIGGSITAGGMQTKNPSNRFVAQVAAWFTKNFPKAKVKFVNAGIGGTNSILGAFRVKADVLDKNPDLVIVEFAVNNKTGLVYNDSLEGLIRQLLADPHQIAVIQLFFMHSSGDSEQKCMEEVGKHYALPMISFHDAWWPEMTAGRTKWYDMYADVVHPNDKGHTLATELMIFLFEKARKEALSGAKPPQIPAALPAPMISDDYAHSSLVVGPALTPVANNGWVRSANGKVWESGNGDTSIEFETTGTFLYLGFDVDKPTESQTTYSIDGAAPQPLKMDGNRPPLATKLAPGKHRIKISYAGSQAKAPATTPVPATGAQPAATPWPDPAGLPPAKLSIWGISSAGM